MPQTDEVVQFRTTIECKRADGAWEATEPAGDTDVLGRGDDPREAVANYVEALNA